MLEDIMKGVTNVINWIIDKAIFWKNWDQTSQFMLIFLVIVIIIFWMILKWYSNQKPPTIQSMRW